MTKPLRFDDDAAEEMEEAAQRYEARRANLGRDFLAAVRAVTDRIAERPATWLLAPGIDPKLGVRRCLLRRFPFAVI